MIRLTLVVVLCSSLAFGQDAGDAPKNPYPEGRSLILPAHEAVPFGPALCLEETEAKRREWAAQRDLGELEQLKKDKGSAIVSVPVLVAIIVGSLAIGAAVGTGVALAVKPKP